MVGRIVVLSTIANSGKGGIASSVANSVSILGRAGINYKLVTTHAPLSSVGTRFVIFLRALLEILIKHQQGDIYFLHVGPKGSLIRKVLLALAIKARRGRIITQYHSPLFLQYMKRRAVLRSLLSLLAKLSDVNLALNIYWKRVFTRGLCQDFEILPNPIISRPNTPRSSFDSKKGTISIACVARLVEEKNVQEVIRYAQNDERVALRIAGGGPYKPVLENLAKDSVAKDRICFLHWVTNQEARDLMENSDIFILPSKYDSFGIVFAEALLCGTPVIAPRIPAVMKTLKGLIGVAYASTAEEIADHVDKLLKLRRQTIKSSAELRFSEEDYIKKLESIITKRL